MSDLELAGVTWRDIEFAAQLEETSPVVIALLCTFHDWQNARIEQLYKFLDGVWEAQTETEGRLFDLEQLHEEHRTTQCALHTAHEQIGHLTSKLEAMETRLNHMGTWLARANVRL